MQYVKYTIKSINIEDGITKFRDKWCVLDKQVKHKNKQIKMTARDGIRTRDLLHRSGMRYLWDTESTEGVDCCQTVSTQCVETYINKAEIFSVVF